jgi:hypothetical protein
MIHSVGDGPYLHAVIDNFSRQIFDGQTLDEMYFATGTSVPGLLAEAHQRTRAERLAVD